jgi:YegS/Rv2252/BmrU family lipid kinase
MRDERFAAIINPISGAGADPSVARQRIAMLQAEFDRRGLHGAIDLTERAGHARELAAASAARGVQTVVVWGGDGTVNEAGGALIGTATALGLVPAGSGNGLAAALGVPREPRAAIAVALDAPARPMDVGMLNGHAFFNVAGVGFDARIAKLFNERSRGSRGRWPYVTLCFREGCRYRGAEYRISLDEDVSRTVALLVVFANGREFGMGARIAPKARLDDGLLDAVIIQDRSLVARVWHARHLALGNIDRAPGVTLRTVRSATVEAPGSLEYHLDGEYGVADRRLEVNVMPGALRVKMGR